MHVAFDVLRGLEEMKLNELEKIWMTKFLATDKTSTAIFRPAPDMYEGALILLDAGQRGVYFSIYSTPPW